SRSLRGRLESASGFQSDQFRQIEFVLGVKSDQALQRFPAGSRARAALERRHQESTLWDSFLQYLQREGYETADLRSTLIALYKNDAKNAELCERLVDLDEGIQEWRYRHVKMVERTIGARPGTGGSTGATYLRETVGRPIFPDLWEIRSHL